MLSKRFNNCIEQLKNHKKINLLEHQSFQILSDFVEEMEVENIESEGYIFTPENKLLLPYSLCYFNWEGIDNSLSGGVRFNGFSDALTFYSDFWKGAFSLAPDAVVPDHLKKFEQLGWFERQYRDDKRIGCFVKQPGVFPPQIAFYNRGWFQITDWTFEEYLEKMLRMYAVKGWQFFFIDFDKAMPYWQEALDDMKNAAELMPEIFEDEDWAWLQLHYEEVCKKLG